MCASRCVRVDVGEYVYACVSECMLADERTCGCMCMCMCIYDCICVYV